MNPSSQYTDGNTIQSRKIAPGAEAQIERFLEQIEMLDQDIAARRKERSEAVANLAQARKELLSLCERAENVIATHGRATR
jgi:hypothetical protein